MHPAVSSEVLIQESEIPWTRARRTSWPRHVRVQGSLFADEESVIGAKIAGRIAETNVDLGMVVRPGDGLASLDLEDFQLVVQQAEAQLAEACAALGLAPAAPLDDLDPAAVPSVLLERAQMDEARLNLQRMERLRRSDAISQAELDQQRSLERVATARYEAALNAVQEKVAVIQLRRAGLAVARQRLRDAVIRAPFQGVVQARHVAAGSFVQTGDPVVTLVRTHPLRYRAGVPEREAAGVRANQKVRIHIEGTERIVDATITRVSPALDLASRSLVVEVDVPNSDGSLRAGLFAEAEIVVDPERTVLSVPATAVGAFAGVHKVWVVREGSVQQQVVRIGQARNGQMEIVSGLDEGERVSRDYQRGKWGQLADRAPDPAELAHHDESP